MIVYADVLIILNFLVDYFLLRFTGILLKRSVKTGRMLLSAFCGAVSSLYIFFPVNNTAADIGVKALTCAVMTFVCFGFERTAKFIRTYFVLTGVTFAFGGLLLAVWFAFRPDGLLIENSVFYFNFSPLFLICSAAVFYLLGLTVKYFFGRKNICSDTYNIELFNSGENYRLNCIADTGNNLSDVFSGGAVIIIDRKSAQKIFDKSAENFKTRFRAVPCKTVGGNTLLDGMRIDTAKVYFKDKTRLLKNPIIAVSKTEIPDGTAIINPEILD